MYNQLKCRRRWHAAYNNCVLCCRFMKTEETSAADTYIMEIKIESNSDTDTKNSV